MDVNFEYYKIFYYVAKYNNFTRAARVLGNSQPNVTRAMNCLEQQLHCTLLVRTTLSSKYFLARILARSSMLGGTGRMCGTVPWEYCNRSQ